MRVGDDIRRGCSKDIGGVILVELFIIFFFFRNPDPNFKSY